MRVLLAGQAYYRRDNGQAVFTMNLAEGLTSAGHQVLVMAPSPTGKAARKVVHGVTIQGVPAVALIDNTNVTAFSQGLVARTMTAFQPDVVHVQDHYFLSRSVVAVARAQHRLTVGTNHFLPDNLTDNLPLTHWLHKPLDQLLWSAMLTVYNHLDAVSTPTETAAAILRAQGLRVPVTAISCGVDVERFRPRPDVDRARLRQRYGLAMDKTILLYVGRLDREKDLDLLIRAFAQVPRTDLQLVLGGKGGELAHLKRICDELALAEKVIFPGFIADADLPQLLNSADLFVMPSHAELQSIATLEAMASGLPILAANARALPELVQPGVNGQLFTAGDVADAACKINELVEQQATWSAMGAASRSKAEHHAHKRAIVRYLHWYQEAAHAYQLQHATGKLAPAH